MPPSRPYTVTGNRKIAYPQSRVMKNSFPGRYTVHIELHFEKFYLLLAEESGGELLRAGESVVVLGASTKRGHLVVERSNHTLHVPYHYLELRPGLATS